jgi:hypothetical protein
MLRVLYHIATSPSTFEMEILFSLTLKINSIIKGQVGFRHTKEMALLQNKQKNFSKDTPSFTRFEIPNLNFKNSQFTPLSFQLYSIWTPHLILAVKNTQKKGQNIHDFHFFKIKKNVLEVGILYKSHRYKRRVMFKI